ncbi:hypothetical protein [Aquimarina algiphila]|uniref:hypothetical protein n=1 Tax=Aquimarina algiphila TaxID=2047982 RepID=UPI002493CBA6|nr:hypothetical protein [Aquimarina algiphila]
MKKLRIWYTLMLSLLLGFISCEQTEDFDNEPKVEIVIDNQEGSGVYSFEAKTIGMSDNAQVIWSVDGKEIEGEDQENIINQILDYLFKPGSHTICVKVITDQRTIEACTEIEVEVDENDPCPDLFFKTRQYERPSTYKFIADFDGVEEASYEWFINGDLVKDTSENGNNYLIWNFKEAGRYEVCMKTETPDCPLGTSYCKVIEIEESDLVCPEVSFTKEMEPGTFGTYTFEAQIESNDDVAEIKWYVNGDLVESPTDPQVGNRTLYYQFGSGTHEVCLKVTTQNCPEGIKYCKEIRVGDCPDLFFEPERDGDKNAYYFYPRAFDGIDDVVLEWFVDEQYVGRSPEFPHNNPYYYEFDGPGRYEVCLMIETPECPNGTSFCKVIEFE